MPEELSIYDSSVYEKAKSNLEEMLTSGVLFQDETPCYYIYELVMDGRSQTGLVCCSSVDDYENDIIKKHEFTRSGSIQKQKVRSFFIIWFGSMTKMRLLVNIPSASN
jgi:uncharacterized protein (DUF1015 family)